METKTEGEQGWEELCHQCGDCCFEKLESDEGTIFFTQTPCRYLDISSRQCKIYDRRFAINPDCIKLTPELVRKLSWLHDGCGYIEAFGLRHSPGGGSEDDESSQ
jgi:uncharacterized cysteine cluster protein YcgN (CxxCxxCC family)